MIQEENYGYILRISEDEWEKQVFEIKKVLHSGEEEVAQGDQHPPR